MGGSHADSITMKTILRTPLLITLIPDLTDLFFSPVSWLSNFGKAEGYIWCLCVVPRLHTTWSAHFDGDFPGVPASSAQAALAAYSPLPKAHGRLIPHQLYVPPCFLLPELQLWHGPPVEQPIPIRSCLWHPQKLLQ